MGPVDARLRASVIPEREPRFDPDLVVAVILALALAFLGLATLFEVYVG